MQKSKYAENPSRLLDANILENVARDAKKIETLEAEGWGVAVVWSCETRNVETLASNLSAFLGPANLGSEDAIQHRG